MRRRPLTFILSSIQDTARGDVRATLLSDQNREFCRVGAGSREIYYRDLEDRF